MDLTNDDRFGAGLEAFAGSDKAKTEFLLRSFPSVYCNTIAKIKSKDHGYDSTMGKLKEYIAMPEKGKKNTGER